MSRFGSRTLLHWCLKYKQKMYLNLVCSRYKTPAYIQRHNYMRFHVNGLTCEYDGDYTVRYKNVRFKFIWGQEWALEYTILPINLMVRFTRLYTSSIKAKVTINGKYTRISASTYKILQLVTNTWNKKRRGIWVTISDLYYLDSWHGFNRALINEYSRPNYTKVSNSLFDEIEIRI